MKKIMAALLAAVMALPFASCGEAGQASPPAVPEDAQISADTAEAVTETELKDNLPEDLDFGGRTVNLVWNPLTAMREINFESLNGEVVDDALYTAGLAVSERLNVSFSLIPIESNNSTQGNFVKAVSKSVMAGGGDYDFMYGYSRAFATLAADGMLSDLKETKYIGLDQPWWARRLLDQSTINKKLYFATGDISAALLYNMVVTFFNKQMIADFVLENPYELVDGGKWTIDKMAEMCKGIYSDLNGNGTPDGEDRYGLSQSPVFVDAFWFSAGLSYTEIGDDGVPRLSEDLQGQKASDLVDKLTSVIHDDSNDMNLDHAPFEYGNVLFRSDELLMAPYQYRDVQFDFGVVPVPVYSEGDEFSTCASFTYQLYGIPVDAKDPDMSSAVMEALAFEGYKTVTPALFETAMKVKYTSDTDSVRMLDIVRDSLNFDLGRLFNSKLDSMTYSLFRDAVTDNKEWTSLIEKNMSKLEKKFDKLLESFGD